MRNFKQPGDVLDLTAPSGGVVGGTGYLIGALFVVAAADADEGDQFEGQRSGVFELPKATGQTWSEGARIYWDDSAKKCTTTVTSNTLIGAAVRKGGEISGATTGLVMLNGTTAVVDTIE